MRETALRKAKEEVGIECHIGPIIHTAETIFPDAQISTLAELPELLERLAEARTK